MRNNLNGFAEVFAAAFLRDNVRVDLACREIRELVEILVDKTLIVTEVEVGFSAVLGYVDLAVLIRTHCAWVDVDVWVELLSRDLKTARFEESAERGGGDAFAETRNYAARNKDIFSHAAASLKISVAHQALVDFPCAVAAVADRAHYE